MTHMVFCYKPLEDDVLIEDEKKTYCRVKQNQGRK